MSAGVMPYFHVIPFQPFVLMAMLLSRSKPRQSRALWLINILISPIPNVNGYVSSSKQTKHIKAKYLYIHHYHNSAKLDLQYCPTDQMWADVLTKSLQGSKFQLFQAFLMNCPKNYTEDLPFSFSSSAHFF